MNTFAAVSYARQEKLLVVLVEFTETTPSDPSYDPNYSGGIKLNDFNFYTKYFNTATNAKSVRNYYREVSGQTLDLIPAAENNGITYNDGVVRVKLDYPHPPLIKAADGSEYILDEAKLIKDVMALVDEDVNFAAFDTNNDGKITNRELHIVFNLASGSGSSNPDGGRSHYTWVPNGGVKVDGKVCLDYGPFSGYSFVDDDSDVFVIAHELGHDLDANDIYQYTDTSFSVMCRGLVHFDPWNKIKIGFATPTLVEASGTYTVNSMDPNDPSKYNVLKIPINNPNSYKDEYYLIENRQFVGFDAEAANFCPYGGIAIWHIEEVSDNVNQDDFTFDKIEFIKANAWDQLFHIGGKTEFSTSSTPSSKRFDGSPSGISIKVNSSSTTSSNVPSTVTVTINFLDAPNNLKAAASESDIKLTWDATVIGEKYNCLIDNKTTVATTTNSYTHKNVFGKHYYRARGINPLSSYPGAYSQALAVRGIKYGDLNFDGVITTADRDLLSDFLINKITLYDEQMVAADVNGDGVINSTDKAAISKVLSGTLTSFPAGIMKLITYGDVNGDGKITSADSALISDYINNVITFTFAQKVAADVDGDNDIDASDKAYVSDFAAGKDILFSVINAPY